MAYFDGRWLNGSEVCFKSFVPDGECVFLFSFRISFINGLEVYP